MAVEDEETQRDDHAQEDGEEQGVGHTLPSSRSIFRERLLIAAFAARIAWASSPVLRSTAFAVADHWRRAFWPDAFFVCLPASRGVQGITDQGQRKR